MEQPNREAIFGRIKDFIESLRVSNKQVTEEALVYHDLGLRGTDAYDLMQFLISEFEVDSADFYFKTYFHDEYFGVTDIVRSIFGLYDKTKEPISVRHLVDVAIEGRWRKPLSGDVISQATV